MTLPRMYSGCVLPERNAALRRELTTLRRFRQAIWDSALDSMQRWAAREGLVADEAGRVEAPWEREERAERGDWSDDDTPTTIWDGALDDLAAEAPSVHELEDAERRRFRRVEVGRTIRFGAIGWATTAEGTLHDVSLGGMFIHAAAAPELDDLVACGLVLDDGQILLVKGRVVRVEPRDGSGAGFGIEFTKISLDHLAWLARLVHEERGWAEAGAVSSAAA